MKTIRRFAIVTFSDTTLKILTSPGFGALLFHTEADAIKYNSTESSAHFFTILPMFVNEEIAARQTVEMPA